MLREDTEVAVGNSRSWVSKSRRPRVSPQTVTRLIHAVLAEELGASQSRKLVDN